MVVIFHKHIVLSVKLRKSERMNVSHKIPTARMQVYSDSDKKYFYMNDLTDKFVCAHCMHACRIHACRILSIFSTHLTVLVPMLPVSGYTLRMYRYLGWPISAASLSSGWNSHSEPEFQPVSAKLTDLASS